MRRFTQLIMPFVIIACGQKNKPTPTPRTAPPPIGEEITPQPPTEEPIQFFEQWTQVSPKWEFKKDIVIQCSKTSTSFCEELCSDSMGCAIPENYCRDCAGTSELLVMDFLKNLGSLYQSTQEEIPVETVVTFLNQGKFFTLSSRSVYNTWTAFDDPALQQRFQTLCPTASTSAPLVFFSTDSQRNPLRVEFVFCEKDNTLHAYKMQKQFGGALSEDSATSINPQPLSTLLEPQA